MKNNSFKPLPPFKGWVLQNFPFIEEDFDAITSYQLWCKVVAYLNNTNNNVNVLAKEVLDIKNYFDNLDVQEEIDNKLDEMAESGQLTDIIAQYLQLAGILAYNTLNDLKNAENIVDGSFTKIYGKLTYNDGYGAFYKIRQLINTDVVDNDNLVALTNYPTLVAEKMKNQELINVNSTINPIGLYKNKNLVVFGDSFTDPDIANSVYGRWVNRVATATGMNAFNYAKGGASFMRENNSIRMQLTRALQMTQEEKNNTSVIIIYSPDTDILENTDRDEWTEEVIYILNSLHSNYANAKIIFAGFTWRVNQLLNEYYQKMLDYMFTLKKLASNLPVVYLNDASYWLLGLTGYYQNQYHPNQYGYDVIATHFVSAIYGVNDNYKDAYNVTLNLDDQTDDRRCMVYVDNDKVEIQFHCVFSQALNNKHDWIANFPKVALPQPDIVFPICTAFGDVVGTFAISAENNGRAELYIKNLPAGTAIFVNGSYRAQANFEYSS